MTATPHCAPDDEHCDGGPEGEYDGRAMITFLVIDLESTSREPAEAHIVEWAAVVLKPEWFGTGGTEEHGGLIKPPILIPAETSAVHHILSVFINGTRRDPSMTSGLAITGGI